MLTASKLAGKNRPFAMTIISAVSSESGDQQHEDTYRSSKQKTDFKVIRMMTIQLLNRIAPEMRATDSELAECAVGWCALAKSRAQCPSVKGEVELCVGAVHDINIHCVFPDRCGPRVSANKILSLRRVCAICSRTHAWRRKSFYAAGSDLMTRPLHY
jgi:hypothetical protein